MWQDSNVIKVLLKKVSKAERDIQLQSGDRTFITVQYANIGEQALSQQQTLSLNSSAANETMQLVDNEPSGI